MVEENKAGKGVDILTSKAGDYIASRGLKPEDFEYVPVVFYIKEEDTRIVEGADGDWDHKSMFGDEIAPSKLLNTGIEVIVDADVVERRNIKGEEDYHIIRGVGLRKKG